MPFIELDFTKLGRTHLQLIDGPRARIDGRRAKEIVREWRDVFRPLGTEPGMLEPEERAAFRHRLLQSLMPRLLCLASIYAVASLFFTLEHIARGKKDEFWVAGWCSLVLCALLPVFWLFVAAKAPYDESTSNRKFAVLASTWVAVATAIFALGGAVLPMQPFGAFFRAPDIGGNLFVLLLVNLTVCGPLLLSASRSAVIAFAFVGTLLPFHFAIMPRVDLPLEVWHVLPYAQIAGYGVLGLVFTSTYQSLVAEGILLERQTKLARKHERHANHFISAVSHDLRQPLAAIKLKLMARGADEITPEDHAMLLSQANTIENIVGGSLDLSLLSSGTWKLTPHDIALPLLLDRLVADLSMEASQKNLVVRSDGGNFLVRSDPVALERILRNLVLNAIRYTLAADKKKPGEIVIRSWPEAAERGRAACVRVSVIDHGIGIPKGRRGEIMREFVQLHNPERDRNKGLGLGLSIVRGLTERLGHGFGFNSTEGVGSTFWITLPLLGTLPEELMRPSVEARERPDFGGMIVAVVDDDTNARNALADLLLDWGCHVIAAPSPKSLLRALSAAAAEDGQTASYIPEAIICDYRLRHGMTGVAALNMIHRSLGRPIPSVIWTGDTNPLVLENIDSAGFPKLRKPPDRGELLEFLRARTEASA